MVAGYRCDSCDSCDCCDRCDSCDSCDSIFAFIIKHEIKILCFIILVNDMNIIDLYF